MIFSLRPACTSDYMRSINWFAISRHRIVFTVFLTLYSHAWSRNYYLPDGNFTICNNPSLTNCKILNENSEREFNLLEPDKRVLADLRKVSAINRPKISDLIATFGHPTQVIIAPKEIAPEAQGIATYFWQTKSNGICKPCGIEIILQDGRLAQLKYYIYNKFSVVWWMPEKRFKASDHHK